MFLKKIYGYEEKGRIIGLKSFSFFTKKNHESQNEVYSVSRFVFEVSHSIIAEVISSIQAVSHEQLHYTLISDRSNLKSSNWLIWASERIHQ